MIYYSNNILQLSEDGQIINSLSFTQPYSYFRILIFPLNIHLNLVNSQNIVVGSVQKPFCRDTTKLFYSVNKFLRLNIFSV